MSVVGRALSFCLLNLFTVTAFAAAAGNASPTAAALVTSAPAPVPSLSSAKFDSHGFRGVQFFKTKGTPRSVLIFLKPKWLSGEAVEVAKRFSRDSNLVILVDPNKFSVPSARERRQCASLADCLVALSAYVQRREKLIEIQEPALLAVGETGVSAEAAWHEASLSTFSAIISVDYCPRSVTQPRVAGKRTLWSVVGTPKSQRDCAALKTALLPLQDMERVPLAVSPHVRTGPMFRWVSHRLQQLAIQRSLAHDAVNLDDLGLILQEPTASEHAEFVVLYSGDGGWAEFTDDLATEMSRKGLPVVGINSMRYFWRAKSPDVGADDLARIIRHYALKWNAKRVHLAGFSFGAGTLPFFARRLPQDLRSKIASISLLAAYRKADFEFTLSDWFFDDDRGDEVMPEVKQLQGLPKPLCIFPTEEKSTSLCTQDPAAPLVSIELPGGHHFGNDTSRLIKTIFPDPRSP